ncbi:MAG: hypothetical protein R6U32_07860 [Candidatus Woesearchaeota archaeon]
MSKGDYITSMHPYSTSYAPGESYHRAMLCGTPKQDNPGSKSRELDGFSVFDDAVEDAFRALVMGGNVKVVYMKEE